MTPLHILAENIVTWGRIVSHEIEKLLFWFSGEYHDTVKIGRPHNTNTAMATNITRVALSSEEEIEEINNNHLVPLT